MTVVEQKGDPVILGRDRIVGGGRNDRERFERELESAGCALVLAHDAGHLERGFLAHVIRRRETLRAEIRERRDALAYAGAVAHLDKMYLAARALTREPSFERDFVAGVFGQFFDVDARHVSI